MKTFSKLLVLLVLSSSCSTLSFSKDLGYEAYFSTPEQKEIARAIERNDSVFLKELMEKDPEKLFFSGDRWVTPLVVAVAAGNDWVFDQLLALGGLEKLSKRETQRLLTAAAYAEKMHYMAKVLKQIPDLDSLYQGELSFLGGLVYEELPIDRFRDIVKLGFTEEGLGRGLSSATTAYHWDYILVLLEEGANPTYGKYLKNSLIEAINTVLGRSPSPRIKGLVDQVVKLLKEKYGFEL